MTDYQALSDAYLELLLEDPNTCVEMGVEQKLDELPDPSLAGLRALQQQAEQLAEQAEALQPTLTDFHQRLDAELIALTARQYALDAGLEFNGRLQAQQLPDAGEEISSGIFFLVTLDPRPAADRLDNILARLQQVPDYLRAMLGRLDTPVARWVDIDCESIAGLPEFFASILDWAREVSYAQLDALSAAIDTANASIADYQEALKQLPTTSHFHIGREAAESIVASKGIELSLEEIHQVAREFVTSTRSQIESLRQKLVAKYGLEPSTTAPQLQTYLAEAHAVKVEDGDFEQVIRRYQQVAGELETFVTERDLFPVPDGQAMNIIQTPGFMRPMIPAGAMMPPPALRKGTRTSMVYLTLSQELLAEHTELGIPLMMVHEGIPGHHLQLSTATMHSSIVRRTFNANEHAEGWTTMLEDYMLDQGLMGDLTDEARFVTKLDLSRIGARVAIDLYFMTGDANYLDIGYDVSVDSDDPFANAASLLIAATGFTPGRAQSELNWYSQERGYPLSYLVGNRLVWDLKRDFQRATGASLSSLEQDREFHRIYLESGNMPVAKLRAVFTHELGRPLQ